MQEEANSVPSCDDPNYFRRTSESGSEPRISDLRLKHEMMENKINELRDFNRKRDEELQAIKETIRECKEKVTDLRQSMDCDKQYMNWFQQIFSDNWDIRNTGNWKMMAGLGAIYCLMTCDVCFRYMPVMPSFYGVVYLAILFYHFTLVTAIPLVRAYFSRSLSRPHDSSFERIDCMFLPWYYLIGACLSAMAIIVLQMKGCSSHLGKWSLGPSIQVLTTVGSYLVEIGAFSYANQYSNKRNEACDASINKANQWTAGLVAVNILVSITTN